MIIQIEEKQQFKLVPFVACSNCNEMVFRADHVKVGQKIGPWHCELCGHSSHIERTENVFKSTKANKKPDTQIWSMLEIPVQESPIYVLQKNWVSQETDVPYWLSNTCPINNFRSAKAIGIGFDDDPHGLFKYLKSWNVDPKDTKFQINSGINSLIMQKFLHRQD